MAETIIKCECDFLLPPGLVLSGQDSLDLSSDLEFQAHSRAPIYFFANYSKRRREDPLSFCNYMMRISDSILLTTATHFHSLPAFQRK